MSSTGRFLDEILDEIERHKNLYRFVDIKSVIATREGIPGREGKWHNVVTLLKMMHSGSLRPWKKQVERGNFVILTAVTTLGRFKKILGCLLNEQILEVDKCEAHGPFDFTQMEFLDSEQSKRLYDIDWAVNRWRVTGKENLGLPSSRGLELESENVPFKDTGDAIRYYTGMPYQSVSELQNAIHIVAPLYYARIKKAELFGSELSIEIDFNIGSTKNFRIGYNTEGPDDKSSYYKPLEAGTVRPAGNTMTIPLKHNATMATIWLYHNKGYKIDSNTTRRTPSIETIEKELSLDSPSLWKEGVSLITETINRHSNANMLAIITTEQGVDSIDVEILKAVKTRGGDYHKFIPEILKFQSLNILLSRLARLKSLGFIIVQPPGKILLTPLGVDTLNLPPSALSAKVPPEVGKKMAEINLAFQEGDYDEVINKSTKLLEDIIRKQLETKFKRNLQDSWRKLNVGPYDRASLGKLKDACVRLHIFKTNSIPDHLISTILQIRVPISHEKGEIKSASHIALSTLRLMEAFLSEWYYPRL